ncbi:hypothetical protein, partial [Thiolapillus sp.]|uniref:hypothetical protein n=1 Tax=Thiolapillus sp. TaxID=2017437 RepID=UPI003AF6226F
MHLGLYPSLSLPTDSAEEPDFLTRLLDLAGGCRLIEWHFIRQLPCYVDSGITQRDQFRNDEVDLYETIVREAVQNSLDATPNG